LCKSHNGTKDRPKTGCFWPKTKLLFFERDQQIQTTLTLKENVANRQHFCCLQVNNDCCNVAHQQCCCYLATCIAAKYCNNVCCLL